VTIVVAGKTALTAGFRFELWPQVSQMSERKISTPAAKTEMSFETEKA
jgi:hypothetical protein